MKSSHFSRKILMPFSVDKLWSIVSRTDDFNYAAGLPSVKFSPIKDQRGYVTLDTILQSKMPLYIHEMPFEWVKNQYFRVERIFKNLPFTYVFTTSLKPKSENETELILEMEIKPRNPLGSFIGSILVGTISLSQLVHTYERIREGYLANTPQPFAPPKAKPNINETQLRYLVTQLQQSYQVKPELLTKLVTLLRSGLDSEVSKIRPFKLAEAWQESRLEVLHLFLHATRIGLLDMSWEVLCPNCRVIKGSYSNLNQLQSQAHCEVCDISYDAKFDEHVELRFAVNPRVRDSSHATYCIAGPSATAHIIAQNRVKPNQTSELKLDLAPGLYRLRFRPKAEPSLLRVVDTDNVSEVVINFDDNDLTHFDQSVYVTSTNTILRITNRTEQEVLALLEQMLLDEYIVTAAYVTTLQEFRNLFSSEVLAPGLGLEVRSLTFLFTDLKNSTTMYERIGDTAAYSIVRDHFTLLAQEISQQEGALVKTMGDAVMAVFSKPQQAVAAALKIQEKIPERNSELLTIKLGLHSGPAIAVTANEILDYFGTTVNIAARLQTVSSDNNLILTETVWQDLEVQKILENYEARKFSANLKGLSQSFNLYQIARTTVTA